MIRGAAVFTHVADSGCSQVESTGARSRDISSRGSELRVEAGAQPAKHQPAREQRGEGQ